MRGSCGGGLVYGGRDEIKVTEEREWTKETMSGKNATVTPDTHLPIAYFMVFWAINPKIGILMRKSEKSG